MVHNWLSPETFDMYQTYLCSLLPAGITHGWGSHRREPVGPVGHKVRPRQGDEPEGPEPAVGQADPGVQRRHRQLSRQGQSRQKVAERGVQRKVQGDRAADPGGSEAAGCQCACRQKASSVSAKASLHVGGECLGRHGLCPQRPFGVSRRQTQLGGSFLINFSNF